MIPARKTTLFFLFLGLAFLFRLAFGLCSDIVFIDQRQIYLIGLKYFSTGAWPFFGADVAYHIQLPGALQGLVVGLPLKLFPVPEAPYLFLALLSFAGLGLLGWYLSQRLPRFPQWFLWGWLMTAPWVLNWSTNIDNDSYMLFGSCLFFVGLMEVLPPLTLGLLPTWLAWGFMGFALGWEAQFHLSYVLLFPITFVALGWHLSKPGSISSKLSALAAWVIGLSVTVSFIVPTWAQYGLAQGSGNTASAITFNSENLTALFTVLFRYLALGCCEIPRFFGANTAERVGYLKAHLWAAPFAVIAAVLGLGQLILLFIGWFLPNPNKDWKAVKNLTALTALLIYVSFLFAIKTPAAHTYYLTLPLVMVYGFYVLSPYTQKRWFMPIAATLLVCNLLTHTSLALRNLPVKSLYSTRDLFAKAIDEKNYHLLGERRDGSYY